MTVEEAFGKFGPELLRHAAVLVGPDHAGDVVSEALIGALRSKGWDGATSQVAYLHRSVLNSARMHHRSGVRRHRREWTVASTLLDTSHQLLPRPDVVAAVRSLSLQQRSVIYFTYWEDLGVNEVATIMAISEGSVKKHLARARAQLRKVLHD